MAMPIITVRVDEDMKRMMDRLKHINWSEVVREAIAKRIREELRRDVDRRRLIWASSMVDSLRRRASRWSSVEEIRRWRERR